MRNHSTIRTYRELARWVHKFTSGEIHSLVIFGSPGLGKSETVRQALGTDKYSVTINGRLSAFNLFHRLSADVGALFVFDDTRGLLRNGECVNILMQLAENKATKTIQWNTGKKPCEPLETTSRACILINKLDKSEDLEPIVSRSICVHFAPSKTEVHNHVGTWFRTSERRKEIYDYVGANLHLIPSADIRDYVKSEAVYDLDWRTVLQESWTEDPHLAAVLQVMADPALTTVAAQVAAFVKLTGASRAAYFRAKHAIQPMTFPEAALKQESLKVSPIPASAPAAAATAESAPVPPDPMTAADTSEMDAEIAAEVTQHFADQGIEVEPPMVTRKQTTCTKCGVAGHNSRTCKATTTTGGNDNGNE